MSILEIFKLIGRYDMRILVSYYPKNWIERGLREQRSNIMKLENVTYRHIDHWTYKKHVWKISPCVDKKGKPFLYIQLEDDDI